MWLTGRSNSRFRRAAPKVGNLRRRASRMLLDFRRGLAGTMMMSTVFAQPGGSLLLVASPPFAYRQGAGSEQPGGGLDAPLADRSDQTKAMIIGISHFTDQLEVAGGGHSGPILVARHGATLPPVAP